MIRRFAIFAVLLAGVLLSLAAGSVSAQEVELSGELGPQFGEDPRALEALGVLRQGKHIRARELAEEILREDPDSYVGRTLLGVVLHRAEGNLPMSLFQLEHARETFENRWGPIPGDEAPWAWHTMILGELARITGEMGRHEDKIRYLEERDALYFPPWPADRGWPLMRLRRYDEARQVIQEGLESGDPEQIATAKTALCAVEAEMQHREAAYWACLEAAADDRRWPFSGPTTFTNAAEASLGMLKLAEAESLILEATEREAHHSVSNPWLDLTLLYLSEGRTSESLETVREMFAWRDAQPAYIDQQNRADTEMASAVFLLVAGRVEEAARITARALARPDRTGFTSAETEQLEAASALLDHVANRMVAELAEERAASSTFWQGLEARAEAAARRLRAWNSGRRFTALVTDRRILLATLRPYLAGSIEVPEWIEPEMVALLGPGVVEAAVAEARKEETLAEAEGHLEALSAEAARLQGRESKALAHGERALELLPPAEHLLRARVQVAIGSAALEAGERGRALAAYDQAMQLDAGVVRRAGVVLPTTFAAAGGGVAEKTVRYLRRSPRLEPSSEGFRVEVTATGDGAAACLLGVLGSRLGCAQITRRGGEPDAEFARRLALEFHATAFAPKLDLTQSDLSSLDGSPVAGGGRSQRRLETVLDEVEAAGDG